MGSTEKEQTTQHHPPHISSLVVRPSGSNDREDGRNAAGDYEPGEVSRDRPSFNRSDRYKGDNGGSYLF
ncbi:hypothetical protein AXX17_AT4G33310 [Arabidopsis thaliana]|jgi:hypothetical protein|uniref:Uncharacterized protein n=1 Tax=Arabidopsis thaliana TaxID=3702 RepID=A0A178V133_ARATH|nr:hypothetical protein AXX17_AT4G33310 [Arabidopsis thaliana]